MRILLDENIPVELAAEFAGHQTDTVVGLGWAGVGNGERLRRAAWKFDALVTMDTNIEYQQTVSALSFAVLVVRAPSNRVVHLRPLMPAILAALPTLTARELRRGHRLTARCSRRPARNVVRGDHGLTPSAHERAVVTHQHEQLGYNQGEKSDAESRVGRSQRSGDFGRDARVPGYARAVAESH